MNKRALFVLVVYGVISAVGLHFHELFLDEAHHFLVSRDSSSLGELYYHLRYDGHPRLWGVLLFLITHFITPDPTGMQALQWLFAMAGAFVLLRYAPFPLWMKALILSGYYFVFEYSVLSRNYAIGIWMLWLCCHLLRSGGEPAQGGGKQVWWIGVLMLLMCSAHLFFTFAAIGIFVYVLAGQWGGFGRRAWPMRRLAVLSVFFVIGLTSAIIQARTASVDNVNMTPVHPAEWLSGKNFSFAAGALVQGWLPVPQVNGGRFWNTGWLNANHLGPVAPWLLFIVLLGFPAVVLWRKSPALLFYYVTVGLMLVFFVVTQMTANRYFGMVYVFFLAALWLAGGDRRPVLTPESVRGGGVSGRLWLASGLWWWGWMGILVVQVLVGAYAWGEDIRRPFSQSRNAAEYLRDVGTGRFIVLDGYTAGPPLCAYLETKLYCLTTGTEGSFCIWRKEYFPVPRLTIGEEFARDPALRERLAGPREAAGIRAGGGLPEKAGFILVSNRNLGGEQIGGYRLTPLKSFENSIVGENYYIYEVDPVP